MTGTGDLVDLVARSLSGEAAGAFEERVAEQASELREAIAAGEMDNEDFALGLELEAYAVAESGDGPERLAALPDAVFGAGAGKELGVHNAELNTDPTVFDEEGLASQAGQLAAAFADTQALAREAGVALVGDAMWTLPPESGSERYLECVTEHDGVTLPANMRPDPRYVAIDNDAVEAAGGSVSFSVPGAEHHFPTILFESLATSIQPHLQIPSAEAFPGYYNAAIRTLGPVLALSVNSPFLPGDLYTDVEDPDRLLERTHHELRIAAFEQSVNHTPNPKVRVPRDIDEATDVVDRVVADDLYAPFLREWIEETERSSPRDRHWEFDHKRGTYWRWLRAVVGGDPVDGAGDERSLRIEYRPIPTQPTVADVVGMQALTAGLIRGLVAAEHPIEELPWAAAERSFYAAAESGLEADLAWVTSEGERTTDSETVFEEVFEHARKGLSVAGLSGEAIEGYLGPIEARWAAATTPSDWKKARVREELTEGRELPGAIASMQRRYIRRCRETDSFAEWL